MSETFSKSNCLLASRRHDGLVRAGKNPTLADVQRALLLDGLRCSETDTAALLLAEPLTAASRRGTTGKSAVADAATRNAARLSRLAEDSDCDAGLHGQAEQAHKDARSHHLAVAAFHLLSARYHRGKANPATPAEASAAPPLEEFDENGERRAAADTPNRYDAQKTVICPACGDEYRLLPAEACSDIVTCEGCGERINVSSALQERYDENLKQITGDETELEETPLPVDTQRSEPAGAPLCCARSLPHLMADAAVPSYVLYMPGGIHRISPSQGGKAVTVVVKVDASSAARLEKQRRILAASGNKPFFSVQHNTQIAAFWPSRLYWTVQPDPTGKMVEGIWADGEWTAAGREAVEGKNFRSFSPTFFVDAVRNDEDNPVAVMCNEDAPLNMGALENDPAFGGAMSPLWPDNQPQPRA